MECIKYQVRMRKPGEASSLLVRGLGRGPQKPWQKALDEGPGN